MKQDKSINIEKIESIAKDIINNGDYGLFEKKGIKYALNTLIEQLKEI